MSNTKIVYDDVKNFTITLSGLTNSATSARQSATIQNTGNYLDYLCQVGVTLTGTPANDKAVYIFVYGSSNPTFYTDPISGITDANVITRSPSNLKLVQVISAPDPGMIQYTSSPFTISQAFGGVVPTGWGIIVRNFAGWNAHSSSTGHFATYQGAYLNNV